MNKKENISMFLTHFYFIFATTESTEFMMSKKAMTIARTKKQQNQMTIESPFKQQYSQLA